MVAAQPLQSPHSATFGKPRACFRKREWKLSLDRYSSAGQRDNPSTRRSAPTRRWGRSGRRGSGEKPADKVQTVPVLVGFPSVYPLNDSDMPLDHRAVRHRHQNRWRRWCIAHRGPFGRGIIWLLGGHFRRTA